ncbi:hypothetical protein [Actinomadura macra]|uniref:hypothetical protein n=1 Tax=Actinomadura macra TaxID=46164 RepID=UPI000836F172|nr:hypothetical protein [Actinomadura macra]
MADERAQTGFVSLRRVLRGLLVLAGLLFAGWLLGGLAQSAHADELPSATTIVEPTVERVVNEVIPPHTAVASPVVEKKASKPAPPPVRVASPARPRPVEKVVQAPRAPEKRQRALPERSVVRKYRVTRHQTAAPAEAHIPAPVVRPAPVPAPVQDESTAAGALVFGGSAGLPGVLVWAPAQPRASLSHALSPVPPAVRTAADEPSFAPD